MSIPADDPKRSLTITNADDPGAQHIGLVGDTYTVLLGGAQTAGRYCLIEMRVPHCGGPGPHRHDFEEMFTVLEGEIEVTFRGEKHVVKAGSTVNIPANAPHFFTNRSTDARMLCMCTPAGAEEFFAAVGTKLASKHDVPAKMSPDEMAAWAKNAAALAPKYRTEILKPPGR
jgi:quercetin dioxygenase-like cupin family protein